MPGGDEAESSSVVDEHEMKCGASTKYRTDPIAECVRAGHNVYIGNPGGGTRYTKNRKVGQT